MMVQPRYNQGTTLQPDKMKLRPYQITAIQQLRAKIAAGKTRLILCAPTGAGKTVMFSYIAKSAIAKGKSVLVVTDRLELMKQAGGALRRLDINAIEIKAGEEPKTLTGDMYVAMVETLSRRMKDARYQKLVSSFDVIIFDEAHKQAFNKLFGAISERTVVIGATATPYRDKNQNALSEFYSDIVEVTDIGTLIQEGYLATPHSYGVPVDLSSVKMRGGDYDETEMGKEYMRQRVWAGVIDNYKRLTPGKKALIFSSSIESSQEIVDQFCQAGYNAKHLDSYMGNYERVKVLNWFRNTPDAILSNVGILTTGFDAPELEVIILYRATKSLPLFLQMCGRGSRVIESQKEDFFILDFGENIRQHGFWESKREWSLKKAKKRKPGAAPVKNCPGCGALVHISAPECPECGEELRSKKEIEQEQRFAELELMLPHERRAIARNKSIEEKAVLAKAKIISPYWVLHNLRTKAEAVEFTRLMGWKPGWWFHNQDRFKNLK